jgi:SagB-type dehydrogenase family enzyme
LAATYHDLTKHSPHSVQSNAHYLDWSNQPLPFKIYTSLEAVPLPTQLEPSEGSALEAIASLLEPDPARVLDSALLARLLFYANGITRMLRGMAFRAAACTGALYHIELYVACQDLPDLAAGVYHYGAHDHALRRLRAGDHRSLLVEATGGQVSAAQAVLVLTSTFWRNAWKYQARAYRHSFWDSGTVVANLLAVASAQRLPASVVLGFVDSAVNQLLDVEPRHEAAICLVALGTNGTPPPPAPPVEPLRYPTRALSAHEVEYPAIAEAHAATSLADGDAVAVWRAAPPSPSGRGLYQGGEGGAATTPVVLPWTLPIEQVITRRGSSRRFSHSPIALDQLQAILAASTQPIPSDVAPAGRLTTSYLIVNAVSNLAAGTYVYRSGSGLQPLRHADLRRQAGYLDLGQELAADAAVNIYSLCNLSEMLSRLGDRGYRAAQLEGAIEGGKLYLSAYALGLGATGLTFFDDDVSRFFDVPDHAVMFLTAIGHPRTSRTR